MKIILVVAHGKNLEIGKDNKLLWHVPEDLKQFKSLTLGKTLIMGRKTFESIGRPLPGRKTVVITANQNWHYPLVDTYPSLAVALSSLFDLQEVLIVGGGMIYKESLPLAHELWVTTIDYEGEADTYFPSYKDQFQKKEELILSPRATFSTWQRCE